MRVERRAEVRLTVEVRPRAARDEILPGPGGAVRARVTAPPVGGAANDAVRALLSAALGCPRSAVEILRGQNARTKLIRIVGVSPEELHARLHRASPPRGERGG